MKKLLCSIMILFCIVSITLADSSEMRNPKLFIELVSPWSEGRQSDFPQSPDQIIATMNQVHNVPLTNFVFKKEQADYIIRISLDDSKCRWMLIFNNIETGGKIVDTNTTLRSSNAIKDVAARYRKHWYSTGLDGNYD